MISNMWMCIQPCVLKLTQPPSFIKFFAPSVTAEYSTCFNISFANPILQGHEDHLMDNASGTSAPPSYSEIEERDPDWYIDDGNIVLICQSPSQTVYFKVHKSMLSRHSSVFRHMFEMPSPANTERYDGTPSVEMFDEVEHLRDFLRDIHIAG